MAPAEPQAHPVHVEVASSPGPRQMLLVALTLPSGATVREALSASGLLPVADGGGAEQQPLSVGIWGRKAALDTVLREGDRVECYRGLKVDPKEARRVRYRAHGEKLPKGIHRPRGRVVDLTQTPDGRLGDAGD